MRGLFKFLSLLSTLGAASRGNLGRNYVRRKAHKGLARGMRKRGL